MTEPNPAVAAALVLMSLITGEDWDEAKLISSADVLRTTAQGVLVSRGGMTTADADKIIEERWARYVAPIEPVPEPPVLTDVAVNVTPPTPGDIKSRLDDYMNRTGRKGEDQPAPEPA